MKCRKCTSETTIHNQTLFLKFSGKVTETPVKEKLRMIAVFTAGQEDRRILCKTEQFFQEETNETFFISSAEILLPFVFYRDISEEIVSLHFEIENAHETLCLKTDSTYQAALFSKEQKPVPFMFQLYCILAFLVCILLLPLFLLDGYFALKGYKKIDTGENADSSSKKAILFHVNALTKRICGYSYSLREWKTGYLSHCYQKQKNRPVQPNKILFLSERKLEENSNMDCIYQALQKHSNLELETFIQPCTIDKLSFHEIRTIAKKMADSAMIILEDFYPQLHFVSIRKETKIVQLWHACGAFKTFGFSRLGKTGGPQQSSPNHRSYDYAFVSSKRLEAVYAEAFGISGKNIKALGVPRTDFLFDESYKDQKRRSLYEKYPELQHKKVILFAPTFRGTGNKDAFYPMEQFCIDHYMEQLADDTILLLKNHPFVKDSFSYSEKWEKQVFDFSNKENINDLLLVTDLLITDYSSSVFEASLLDIPMIFYVFDKKEYLENRDVYYDFDTFVPGPIAETEEALLDFTKKLLIRSDTFTREKLALFKSSYLDALDGNSTRRIADFLLTLL